MTGVARRLARRLHGLRRDPDAELVSRLSAVSHQVGALLAQSRPSASAKILWSPGFNSNRYFWVHDGLLACALMLRGAEIVPLSCAGAQSIECNIYGGVWMTGDIDPSRLCERCGSDDEALWERTIGLSVCRLSDHLTERDRIAVERMTAPLIFEELEHFTSEDLPIGSLARDSILNMSMLGDLQETEATLQQLRHFVRNGVLLRVAYERILAKIRPDRVMTHDGTYMTWAILDMLAERSSTPYYTYYSGGRKDTWHYVRNGVSLQWDVSPAWPTWSAVELTAAQNERLDAYMSARRTGEAFVLSPVPSGDDASGSQTALGSLDPSKPTALLAANVVWDAAALNKAVVFDSMFRWIAVTIEWFAQHPQYQLVVKPHPVESSPKIPETRQTVCDSLCAAGIRIPENVLLLPSDTAVPAHALFAGADVGLVWTTTVGLEMAMEGGRAIVVGRAPYRDKGFTLDPIDQGEYFTLVEQTLLRRKGTDGTEAGRIRLARLYFYLYYFIYQIDTGLFPWRFWDAPAICPIDSCEALLPGANAALDYVCESILEDRPILGPGRWPPETS